MTMTTNVCTLVLLAALGSHVLAADEEGSGVGALLNSKDGVVFASQYKINKYVERYRQENNPLPDFNGLKDEDGNVIIPELDTDLSGDDMKDWYMPLLMKRIIPCGVFGIVAFFCCCVTNICMCRRFEYADDGNGGKKTSNTRCACCAPPECATRSRGRMFLYAMLAGVLIAATSIGFFGLHAEKLQGESMRVIEDNLDSLQVWVDDAQTSIDGVASDAIEVINVIGQVDVASCDTSVQDELDELDAELQRFIANLTSGGATAGTVALDNEVSSALDEAVGEVQDQISDLKNSTTKMIDRYDEKRSTYTKLGLAFLIIVVFLSALVSFLVGFTTCCKSRHCLLCGWSSIVLFIMLLLFIFATVLLLAVTLWADFCYDDNEAILKIMSTKDDSYEMIEYYLKCPGYVSPQYEDDFPLKEEVESITDGLNDVLRDIKDNKADYNTCSDVSGAPLGDQIEEQFSIVITSSVGQDGLLSANGVIGCAELNERLQMVMDDMCNEIYTPFAMFFELFFVVGWALLCSELLAKCLKADTAGEDAYADGDREPTSTEKSGWSPEGEDLEAGENNASSLEVGRGY